jgi:aspartyl/glutamyl-tRNA(Asn/Gln) amidotransferase subunit B (EC 6.3.5.-)
MTAHESPQNLVKGATGDWEIIVGMEIHAQVTSRSKLFSGASTTFGGAPNSHVSLVDAACRNAAGHQRGMRPPGGATGLG